MASREIHVAVTEQPAGQAVWSAVCRNRAKVVVEDGRYALDGGAVPDGGAKPLPRGDLVLALPSHQVVMRVLDLPVAEDAEIASMVELQIDKFSPFPLDQMVVSHEVLELNGDGGHVLAAVARTSIINALGQRFAAKGTKVVRVDSLLLGRWQTLLEAGQLETDGRETLVMVEDGVLSVIIHDAGALVSLSGLGEIPPALDADLAVDLVKELAHLMVGIEAERGKMQPSTVTLWSRQGTGLESLLEALQKRFPGRVRERSLDVLASAISGVASRSIGTRRGLDLTPAAWRGAEDSLRFRRRMVLIAAASFGAWVMLAAAGWGLVAWQRADVEAYRAAEKRWLEPANAVRRQRMQVQMIQRYMDRRLSALECLREVSRLQPVGVDLTSFTYSKGEGIEIVGEADSGTLVIAFNEQLNTSELFTDVTAGARTLTSRQRHRFSFKISFSKETP